MDITKRLTSLESNLERRDLVLAWFKKAQALGGFFDYCEAALGSFAIEDQETAFFFNLVNGCNVNVLEMLASPFMQLLAICIACLTRSEVLKASKVDLRGIRVLLHNFVVEGLALRIGD